MESISVADMLASGSEPETDIQKANDYLNESLVRVSDKRARGRASAVNSSGRYEPFSRDDFDDGWQTLEQLPPFKTDVQIERARTIITRNNSPDMPFDRSLNPYRGCEHGCVYCFARPTHTYQGLSAGLDFESRLFVKPDAAKLLESELSRPNYKPQPMALGTNTDPYQPIERNWMVTRSLLSVLEACNHPVGIVTKSSLIMRDIDILSRMAKKGLVKVALSITTLDRKLARLMEPRAPTPSKRFETIKLLSERGIRTSVMIAPIIPALNDHEIENILERAVEYGAAEAGYVLLRLPLEVAPIFKEWLLRHYPGRYRHIMGLIRSMRDGKDYDAQWNKRMTGSGPYAWQIKRRFELKTKRLNINTERFKPRSDLFQHFQPSEKQLTLL